VRTGTPVFRPTILETASLEQLTARLQELGKIKSTRSTVRLQVSVVSEDQQEVKEYTEAGGIILIQKPDFIRVRAEFPVVGSTVFDMVSDGTQYKVHLPTENRFLIGENAFTKPSKKRFENVRPQHIRQALVIDPPREDEEVAFLRNVTYGRQAYHVVSIEKSGRPELSREIWFERMSLRIVRQIIYDYSGDPVTDAWYQQWIETESIPFPGLIHINRPKDGYELRVEVLKSGINEDVPANAFKLDIPEGAKVERIGETSLKVPEEDQ